MAGAARRSYCGGVAVRRGAEATELAVTRLMRACPDGEAFRQEAIGLLRQAVGFDGWCWARIDPRSVLPAHGSLADGTGAEAILPRLFRAPYAVEIDPQQPAATLSAETGGTLARSARWRDLLRPLGHHDELRAALADRGLCWGHLVCYRDLAGSPFTAEQAALMSRIAPLLGAHMREGWRLNAAGLRIEDTPGTLVFDAGLGLQSATQASLRWLEALGWPPSRGLPAFVYALAARAADTGSDAMIRARALQGGWASLHAAPLLPASATGSVVVSIGPPSAADVADVLMLAWELSPRERQVTAAIVAGQGTRQAARALDISEHTTRQHAKAVFAKVGVHSRDHLREVLTGGLR
jgi:DNA-binding CsgD family transcriptional regulator